MESNVEVKAHRIDGIEKGSIAERLGIRAGDSLLAVNGQGIQDVLDYHYLINDAHIVLTIKGRDGEDWEYDIEKEYYEDIGIVFADAMMDAYKSCTNHCVFCFIDQMPPNMRETLYFKDDDSRLSFLQGNYITLTNLRDADVERIIRLKMAPINISVHTTNPELRVKMLHNPHAGSSLQRLDQFYAAGIGMNGQIVLCKDLNDGSELERTIRDLSRYAPVMQSLSVVPVGITKFRKGLYPLKPLTKQDAKKTLETIHKWQKICYDRYDLHFVHASDEFYLLADEEFPMEENYDGFVQLENGVGMIPLLEREFEEALLEGESQPAERPGLFHFRKKAKQPPRVRSLVSGRAAAPLMRKLSIEFMLKNPEYKLQVFEIENHFFGESITVSGLLTGKDLREQLSGEDLGEILLLPCNMLRSGERVFLDDVTVEELQGELKTPIRIVGSSGQSLYNAMKDLPDDDV